MKQPNILFILIDDMGWNDLSCQGSTFYETPNIDSLAEDGLRFTNAYASCPVCSPTRASILSGKYPARVGITQWIGGHSRGRTIGAPYLHQLPLEEKSLASTLKENGYQTYHVGKWHLGEKGYWPEDHGFDVNIGGCHMGHPWNGFFSPYNIPNLADGPEGEYLTDRLTDEAISLLKKSEDKPFFLNLWYYSVHCPIQCPEANRLKYEKKLKEQGLDKYDSYESYKNNTVLERHEFREEIRRRVVQSDPTYAGMIDRLDYNIGRLLEALDELGISDNTMVIFYSDNGGYCNGDNAPTSNKPYRDGKSFMYEGGTREPLLIRWPECIKAGTVTDAQITSPDFYPTILECCDLPLNPEQHADGKSFRDVLINPDSSFDRGPMFWHYPHYNGFGTAPGSSVIEGKWKLIEWLEDKSIELYDLEHDTGETTNIAEANPDTCKDLLAKLNAWRDEVDAKQPLPNPNFPAFLADDYMQHKGQLTREQEQLVLTSESETLSLDDIFESYLNEMLQLKIGEIVRTGNLTKEAGTLMFNDTHDEENFALADLVAALFATPISFRAWKQIPERHLTKELHCSNIPHIEFMPEVEV